MGGVKMERRGREWEIFNVVLDMHGVWVPNDFHLFLLPVCAIKVKLNAEIMGFSCSRSLPHIPLQCSDSTFCLWVAASLFLSFFPPILLSRHFHPLSFLCCLCSHLKSNWLTHCLPSVTGHRETLFTIPPSLLPASPPPASLLPPFHDTANRLVVCSVIDLWVTVVTVWLQGTGQLPAVCVCLPAGLFVVWLD